MPSGAAGEPPATLEEFIATVEEQKKFLEKQEVRGGCRSIPQSMRACIETGGGAFKYKLKKTRGI